MEVIHQTPYSKAIWHENHRIMEIIRCNVWNMDDEMYKDEMLEGVEILKKYDAVANLMDNRQFTYILTPELQEWIDTQVTGELLSTSLKKIAFLISPDIFTKISIEQTLEKENARRLKTRFFYEREEAFEWLLQKNQ